MKLSKGILPTIRHDIDAALAAVAAKHGLTFDMGTIRFTENSFSAKLTANVAGFKPEANDFTQYAPSLDLDPTWLGATVRYANRNFEVTGLQLGRGAAKVTVRDMGNDKPYLIKVDLFRLQAKLVSLAPGVTAAPAPGLKLVA